MSGRTTKAAENAKADLPRLSRAVDEATAALWKTLSRDGGSAA